MKNKAADQINKSKAILTWPTNALGVGDPAGRAGADHGPDGHCVQHAALGVLHAGPDGRAGFDADLVDAGELGRAVGVLAAVGLGVRGRRGPALAVRVRVAVGQVLGAAAGRGMLGHVAEGVLAAG